MIELSSVKSLYFLCILWMSGYNKQQFAKRYTVKSKILENKYYIVLVSTIVLHNISCMFDTPKILAIYWDNFKIPNFFDIVKL